jgi:hypothetical protein
MNFKLILIEVFALFASYLVISMPFAYAIQVNIIYGATQETVDYTPENLINKQLSIQHDPIFDPFWEQVKIHVNITNTTKDIEKIYLYKCKGLSPVDCVNSITPEMYNVIDNDLDLEFAWNDVRDQSEYPQIANFLYLIKIKGISDIWFGIWDKIKRTAYNFPEPYFYNYKLDELDLYAKHIEDVYTIKNFIQNYLMIPFNPEQVIKAVFKQASILYEIKTSFLPDFETDTYGMDYLTNITNLYSFVFPDIGWITNPITLNLNPSYTCGDGYCETELGETQANCCYDCPCSGGYYCDIGVMGCRQENDISLGLYGSPDTRVSNCNEPHIINISVRINNPPTDLRVIGSEYRLNNTHYPVICTEKENVYTCPVMVPAMPDCEEGEYKVGPNIINFSISYSDGPNPKTRSIETGFPDIIIGSYICGAYGCEDWLGENQANCCYDCGCPAGYYCDILIPSEGRCRYDLTDNNFYIVNPEPIHFYTHNTAGDVIGLTALISNKPVSLSVVNESCGFECKYNNNPCVAFGDISCNPIASEDPDIYNSSCQIIFKIINYNPVNDYRLKPSLHFSVRYNNGSGYIEKTLTTQFNEIRIGPHWCGDGKCDPDENSNTCCYDCPCPIGYYCDIADIQQPGTGRCAKDDIKLDLVSVQPTYFNDSYIEHTINITAVIKNKPSGLKTEPACSFNNSLPCYISCREIDSLNPNIYNASCQITVPAIDYNTSPFYNPVTKKIILKGNTLNFSIKFNNGSSTITKELSEDLPDIVIIPTYHCGYGPGYKPWDDRCDPSGSACESDLGENSDNCCCDCGCEEGKYCYINYTDPDDIGTCKSVSEIQLVIDKIEPDPIECTIFKDGGECISIESIKIDAHIEPAAGYYLIDSHYKLINENKTYHLPCSPLHGNNYTCSLAISTASRSSDEGMEQKPIEISLSIQHDDVIDTTVSASTNLNIKRVKSDALKSYEEQAEELDKQISNTQNIKNWIIGILAAGVAWCLCTCIPCPPAPQCCPWPDCGTCWLAECCLASIVAKPLMNILNKLDELKLQKEALEAAMSGEEMSEAISDIGISGWSITVSVLSAIGAIFCCGGLFGKIGGPSVSTDNIISNYAGLPELVGTIPIG